MFDQRTILRLCGLCEHQHATLRLARVELRAELRLHVQVMSQSSNLARIIDFDMCVDRLLGDLQCRWHTDLFTVGTDTAEIFLGVSNMAWAIIAILRLLMSKR